eukprot:13610424-Alexandrium_andersonii.AAC.1
MAAGQRALCAEPLPTVGGAPPASDDGPDSALLDAAAAMAASPTPAALQPKPSGAPRGKPRPGKPRPSSA